MQRAGVLIYRISDPEDRALMAYALDAGDYHTVFTAAGSGKARAPPFADNEMNLALRFGEAGYCAMRITGADEVRSPRSLSGLSGPPRPRAATGPRREPGRRWPT